MSAGICDLTQAKTSKELLRLADGALYWAKSQGRDNVVVYSPDVVLELSDTDRADRLKRAQALTSILSLARSIDAKETPNVEHSERVAALRPSTCRSGRLAGGACRPTRRGRPDPRRGKGLHPG